MSRDKELDPEILELGVKYSLYAASLVNLAIALQRGESPNEPMKSVEKSATILDNSLARCGIEISVMRGFESSDEILAFLEEQPLAYSIQNQLFRLYSRRQESIFAFSFTLCGIITGRQGGMENTLDPAIRLLGSIGSALDLPQELVQKCADDPTDGLNAMRNYLSKGSESKKVFIVHGHDEAKKLELKSFLAQLGLEPIILHEQNDLGKAIIEKFEYYASQCVFAFVLLTPDDQSVVSNSTESMWRARQNVIMELGWFMGKLGREKVVILHKGQVEIPSDILGVLYLPFSNSIFEVSEKIRQRLAGTNLI